MNIVNEKTIMIVTIAFTDENGDAVTPDSGTYQIYDEDTLTAIKASSALTSLSSSIDILIDSAENKIVTTTKQFETHIMLVEYIYGTTKTAQTEYRFAVRNMTNVAVS
jgi:hypothetical protein